MDRAASRTVRGHRPRHLARSSRDIRLTGRGVNSNTLYYGDCLDWMGRWPDESVDLIYLDPPFNSNADYNMLYSSEAGGAQYRAFNDTWYWDEGAAERYKVYESAPGRLAHSAVVGMAQVFGRSGMMAYLTYMAERIEAMHRLLRPTGSIYLHCDPTASHGLKLLMDSIFGRKNFRNEIQWRRYGAHNDVGQGSRHFGRVHDKLLFYGKDATSTWKQVFVPLDSRYVESTYRRVDPETGRRFTTTPMTGPGGAAKGNPVYEWNGHTRSWRYGRAKMQELHDQGRIYYSRTGYPRRKLYLDESRGVPVQDVWSDIPSLSGAHKERLGYPTQKPLALLERIIAASSEPGDVLLDPFCGCGTAIEAAHKLKRRWVGVDISSFAIDLIRNERLKGMTIPTRGIPQDIESARKMAQEQPFAFESWAVTRLPGFAPNTKQVADGGVDGRAMLVDKPENFASRLALAQVKGGKFNLSGLRDFIGVTNRDKAALGCFVTLEPVTTRAARAEVAELGKIRVAGRDFNRMSLWPVSDYFEGRLPVLPTMTDPYTGRPIVRSLFR